MQAINDVQAVAPDWSRIDFDVHCSRCGYNLRMLDQPRCPECGLAFKWADVFEVAQWQSDFLFEHQWRKRPIRSYFTSLLPTFRPKRFWSQVSLHTRTNPGALWLMFISVQVWFLLILAGMAYGSSALAGWAGNHWLPYRGFPTPYREIYTAACELHQLLSLPAVRVLPLLALWVALVTLRCLRQTLARCRVKSIHMLRILAYSAGPILAVWTVFILVLGATGGFNPYRYHWSDHLMPLAALLGCVLTLGGFISNSARVYVLLPRPRLVGMVTAALSVLFGFTAIMLWRVGL